MRVVRAASARYRASLARKRRLDRLALGQLLVRTRAQGFRVRSRAQRRLVLPGAIERLRGAGTEHEQVLAVVGRERARLAELELDHRHDAAADQEGHRRDRLERCRASRRGAAPDIPTP